MTTVMSAAFLNSIKTIFIIGCLLVPLMAVMQLLEDTGVIDRYSEKLSPFIGNMGMSSKAAFPLLVGLFFGLAYGAGVIVKSSRSGELSEKDLFLVMIFLSCCHAVVEDTLIFVPFGVNGFFLLAFRILTAVAVTVTAARIFSGRES